MLDLKKVINMELAVLAFFAVGIIIYVLFNLGPEEKIIGIVIAVALIIGGVLFVVFGIELEFGFLCLIAVGALVLFALVSFIISKIRKNKENEKDK